jgi:hypothetical protein
MGVAVIPKDKAERLSLEDVLKKLSATPQGLSSEEAKARLASFEPNALPEKKVNPLLKFLGYFWGPVLWMIEVAAILSLVVKHWPDLAIIAVLYGVDLRGGSGEAVCAFTSGYDWPQTPRISPGRETAASFSPRCGTCGGSEVFREIGSGVTWQQRFFR